MDGSWDFHAYEEANGLRFSWNEWPSNKADSVKVVVPVAVM